MRGQTAVSFENGLVRIVEASKAHDNIVLKKTETFTDEEFDRFLETSRERHFIVVNNFHIPYQDTIALPPAEEKYLSTLVELEIRKRFPDLERFSYFYTVLRETQKEGKRLKETFVFAVNSDEVEAITERFGRYDKTIDYLYPNVLTLSSLMDRGDDGDGEPAMGVVDLGTVKMIFLSREGKLHFVRVAQSDGRGINTLDVENINMTIAYARQSLRLNPARVVFFDPSLSFDEGMARPVIPVAAVSYPRNVVALDETMARYMGPLSGLLYDGKRFRGNLLPLSYRSMLTEKRFLGYGTASFLFFSLLALGYMAARINDVSFMREKIDRLREDLAQRQSIMAEYDDTLRDLQKLTPALNFMNGVNASPDLQKVLSTLSSWYAGKVKVNNILIKNEKEALQLQITGRISADTFAELQTVYETLLDEIRKVQSVEIVKQGLDLKEKGFTVDLKWKI